MKKLLYNARIILPDSIEDGWVLVEDDKIAETGTGDAPLSLYADSYDCDRKYLSPGFIEMHSHGGGGHDFMDGDEVSLKEASMEHLRHGTTSITPTTLTCPTEELLSFFDNYRKVKECWTDGPELLGIHLEGPFFSPLQAGAQDPRYLQAPTPENYMPILEKGGEDIRRVSVAVELDGAMELGQELPRGSFPRKAGRTAPFMPREEASAGRKRSCRKRTREPPGNPVSRWRSAAPVLRRSHTLPGVPEECPVW